MMNPTATRFFAVFSAVYWLILVFALGFGVGKYFYEQRDTTSFVREVAQ